jgi:hypothetical protein
MAETRLQGPFESLESTHEYIRLLTEVLAESRTSIEGEMQLASDQKKERRLEALQLVIFKLNSLDDHMKRSLRLLNDLRSLRRMLLGERQSAASATSESSSPVLLT